MPRILLLIAPFFISLSLSAQTSFTDPSQVSFEVKNFKVRTVKGNFTGMKGEIFFKPDQLDASSFYVCVDASSVDTDNEKRDAHLKNEDFFYVEEYPDICFESTGIAKNTKGYEVTGDLTMHGVNKSVVIPFTYENSTFIGQLEINRFDYDIGKDTGTFSVGKNVKLEIVADLE